MLFAAPSFSSLPAQLLLFLVHFMIRLLIVVLYLAKITNPCQPLFSYTTMLYRTSRESKVASKVRYDTRAYFKTVLLVDT